MGPLTPLPVDRFARSIVGSLWRSISAPGCCPRPPEPDPRRPADAGAATPPSLAFLPLFLPPPQQSCANPTIGTVECRSFTRSRPFSTRRRRRSGGGRGRRRTNNLVAVVASQSGVYRRHRAPLINVQSPSLSVSSACTAVQN